MKIRLPNGLMDGVDLFNYVEIDELRGRQQNYLANHKLIVGNIGHIPKILEDLVKSFETETGLIWKGDIKDGIQKIPSQDIETILIKIREKTYGPRFYFQTQCPHCGHINKDLRLDLSKLKIEHMSIEDMVKPKIVKLPKAKAKGEPYEIELKPAFMKDLFEIVKLSKDEAQESLVTTIVSIAIKRIGDKTTITQEDIAEIYSSDLYYLQEKIEKFNLAGSIDTDIENVCSKCEKEFEDKLNALDPNFFDPTKGSPTTTT